MSVLLTPELQADDDIIVALCKNMDWDDASVLLHSIQSRVNFPAKVVMTMMQNTCKFEQGFCSRCMHQVAVVLRDWLIDAHEDRRDIPCVTEACIRFARIQRAIDELRLPALVTSLISDFSPEYKLASFVMDWAPLVDLLSRDNVLVCWRCHLRHILEGSTGPVTLTCSKYWFPPSKRLPL